MLYKELCHLLPGHLSSVHYSQHRVYREASFPSLGTYNDIGIVFASEDYVLCVMTESGSEEQAKKIMGEVSRMVYEYVESNYA